MPAQNANPITLKTYADNLDAYIKSTPEIINAAEYPWIDQALALVSKEGTILELGSGAGRNAHYIAAKGYELTCTDAVDGFVDVMRAKGIAAKKLDVLQDSFGAEYDMIFANGLLVHFNAVQAAKIVQKVHAALRDEGIFAFSVKVGEGEKWTDEKLNAPRYFHFWQPEALQMLLAGHGFEVVSATTGETSLKNANWLYVIARKKNA